MSYNKCLIKVFSCSLIFINISNYLGARDVIFNISNRYTKRKTNAEAEVAVVE